MSSEYTPTVGEFRQAYVEASGASMAQESYYAEQVAEFERGIARVKAEALRSAADTLCRMETSVLGSHESEEWVRVRDLYARADLIEEEARDGRRAL